MPPAALPWSSHPGCFPSFTKGFMIWHCLPLPRASFLTSNDTILTLSLVSYIFSLTLLKTLLITHSPPGIPFVCPLHKLPQSLDCRHYLSFLLNFLSSFFIFSFWLRWYRVGDWKPKPKISYIQNRAFHSLNMLRSKDMEGKRSWRTHKALSLKTWRATY